MGDVTREEKELDPVATGSRVDAQVIRATRVYEASADYDALHRKYAEAIDTGTKAERLVRAEIDIEIAKDLSANILALRSLTERGAAEANALSRRIYWLNWALVVLTLVLVLVGVGGVYATWWFGAHPNP